jgi:hydrogenase maturation protein HypF
MIINDQQKIEYTFIIIIKGLVQGVGFRPFIYRLAKSYDLKGCVENRNDGVVIKINCQTPILDQFITSIKQKAPSASNIVSIDFRSTDKEYYADFQIINSNTISGKITDICPDLAVCNDCLTDMKIQKNRIDYPFINCTNCGPRFTIIRDLPYDRNKTTMKDFEMCPDCEKEYFDIDNRRFHAQPIACSVCGPEYSLLYDNKIVNDTREIICKLVLLIQNKKIIAIKGMGGFFLACDAQSEEAVSRLRTLKFREGKPFAVMFSSIDAIKEYANVDNIEETSLMSWERPIVLLDQKKSLAPSVSNGLNTIGAMLPYMPIHHLFFEKSNIPVIVLTSGNISDEPVITDNKLASEKLSFIADAVLTYNREIYNRTDDSVVMVVNKKERILRRSRGYVPVPVNLNMSVEGILATGAELGNCFCIGKDNQAIISQHIGDLKNFETYEFYCQTIEHFKKLFNFNPSLLVSDLHPEYLSTKYAAKTRLRHIKIQHHHAHIASCMAENNLDEKVIGVSFDGTGYGDDNCIWGSEFLICDLEEYFRFSHFDYIPMPGGDKVTGEPWRMALAYLYKIYGYRFIDLKLPFLSKISPSSIEMLCHAIDNKINSPLTSGSGRLFDAVAALINLSPNTKFHAEAPMRLESIIDNKIKTSYPFTISKTISFEETIRSIIKDLNNRVPIPAISAKFHNTIISVISEVVVKSREKFNLNKVVLSGGTFQNKYILKNLEYLLLKNNFQVFSHQKIPTNDGGIALGQLVIAAKKDCPPVKFYL